MVFSCRCFSLSFEEEIECETRNQTSSAETFYTAHSDFSGTRSASIPSSRSAPDTISDPTKKSDFPSLAERPSNLRVFALAELKAATGNFDRHFIIRVCGYGLVYRGVIKSLEHPFDEIQVAVKKQEGPGLQITFRDFKPSNILLDDQWNAKLSDFDLSRLGPLGEHSHVSTQVEGKLPYLGPQYMKILRELETQSDVWSYGVFLYQLITGRLTLDYRRPRNERHILEWVKPYLLDGNFRQIVDSRIEGHFPLQSAVELSKIADQCLRKNRDLRPKMSVVLDMLQQLTTKSLQETIPPLVPILDQEGATHRQKVSHEQQSSTMMKFKCNRRFVCASGICSSTN